MLEEAKRLLPIRQRIGRNPRTSSAPPAGSQRERRKESVRLPKLLSSSASSAERSMLRSLLRPAEDGQKKASTGERLRKHEYKDDSEEEEDRVRPEIRARSASYGSVFRNRRETPPLRFVREKTGTQVVERPDPPGLQRKLLFDSEFGCYYDPLVDRYYSVGNS